MQIVLSYFWILRRFGQKFGPYFMVELLLPGGTLLALLLFLLERRNPTIRKGLERAVDAIIRMLAGVFEPRALGPVPAKAAIRVSKSGSANRL
jgi:hypothetical protein